MADGFFEFDTNIPDEALQDESLDQPWDELNDETFGAAAVEDDDWEEQHEQFAANVRTFQTYEVDDEKNGDDNANHNRRVQQKHQAGAAGKSLTSDEPVRGDELGEEFTEKLMEMKALCNALSDDEKSDEEDSRNGLPINRSGRSRKISVNRLDELYGPSSPPGYLHPEGLMSSSGNIWGSPVTRENNLSQQQEGLNSLLKQLQKPQEPVQEVPVVTTNQSISVAQLLRGGEQPQQKPGAQGEPGQQRTPLPRVLTVEELEAQMGLSNPPSAAAAPPPPLPLPKMPDVSQPPPNMLPPGMPVPGAAFAQVQRMFGSMQQQTQQLMNRVQPMPPSTRDNAGIQQDDPALVSVTSSSSKVSVASNKSAAAATYKPYEAAAAGPSYPRHPPPSNIMGGERAGPPPSPFNRGGRGAWNDPGYHHNYPPPGPPPHYNNRSGPPGVGGGDFRGQPHHRGSNGGPGNWDGPREDFHPLPADFHHQRDFHHQPRDYHQRDYQGRGGRGGGRGNWGGYEQRSRHNSYYEEAENQDPNRDPDAGLMTKKEKDQIIYIQLKQLQTDNPEIDDYYYNAFMRKKNNKKEKNGDNDLTVMPRFTERNDYRAYKPVQFENSLGRLTAVSVHNPRHIIDVDVETPGEEKPEKPVLSRLSKSLLWCLENEHLVVLEIEDMGNAINALPPNAQSKLRKERKKMASQLLQRIVYNKDERKTFSQVLRIHKGIALVARFIPLLIKAYGVFPPKEACDVVCELLRVLPVLVNVKRESEWRVVLLKLYTSMSLIINMDNIEMQCRIADALRQGSPKSSTTDEQKYTYEEGVRNITAALRHPLGSSLIFCLLNRGEIVHTKHDAVDMDVAHQEAWQEFVRVVANVMSLEENIAAPLTVPMNHFQHVNKHIRRWELDRLTCATIENKLSKFSICR